jgi:hypothetical protein
MLQMLSTFFMHIFSPRFAFQHQAMGALIVGKSCFAGPQYAAPDPAPGGLNIAAPLLNPFSLACILYCNVLKCVYFDAQRTATAGRKLSITKTFASETKRPAPELLVTKLWDSVWPLLACFFPLV